ncbi:MAG: HmuY family protein [Alphaproteobacteria bacterium]|nr:HmuY family protein [Alphaproteobacteria bacterium]
MTLLTLALACARPPTLQDDTGASADTQAREGEVTTTCADATDESAWVSYDLDGAAFTEDDAWDLGIQRYHVRLNGGVSGDAGVEAAWVEAASLDAVTEAPADGWRTDEADADADGVPEYAFGDWYDYDPATHLLSPKARVWVVRSGEGALWKLRITGYYDDAGSGGHPCFEWAALEGAS